MDAIPGQCELDSALDEDICPPPGGRAPSVEPRRIFLTGVTGFVGAFVAAELLRSTAATVHCLVRPPDAAAAGERIQRHLAASLVWDDSFAPRLAPVPGDLGQPRLGLDAAVYRDLAEGVDEVYHCAAQVNIVLPYRALRAANVLGTAEVLRLAASGHAKPVHFTSTVSVFAARQGDVSRTVSEDSDPDDGPFPSGGYAQSKRVAERLAAAAAQRGLPVAIFRLGRVWGDSRTGVCQPADLFWRIFEGCLRVGAVPDLDFEVALTPVDCIARAAVLLPRHGDLPGRGNGGRGVFHLFNPHPASFRDFAAAAEVLGYRFERLPFERWLALIGGAVGAAEAGLYGVLPAFAWRLPNLGFDCRRTLRRLGDAGVVYPRDNAALIRRYLLHLIQAGRLPPPSACL